MQKAIPGSNIWDANRISPGFPRPNILYEASPEFVYTSSSINLTTLYKLCGETLAQWMQFVVFEGRSGLLKNSGTTLNK